MAECTFCEILQQDTPESPFDVHQSIGRGHMSLMPGLGMLMPGYFLAVTHQHLTSFSQLGSERLREIDEDLAHCEVFLGQYFGEYCRVEHGTNGPESCNVPSRGSGGCIDHGHVQLLPGVDVAERIRDQLPWLQLKNLGDLEGFQNDPYIYFGWRGEHYVVRSPALPSQWARRQAAQVLGIEVWDWALRPGTNELVVTYLALQKFLGRLPRGRIIVDAAHGIVTHQPSYRVDVSVWNLLNDSHKP